MMLIAPLAATASATRRSPGIERRHLEHTHRAVPDHGLRLLNQPFVPSGGLRSDIEPFEALGDFTSGNHLFVAVAREGVAAMCVDRQHQFRSAELHQFSGQVDLVAFHEALPDRSALCQREGIGHRTSDEHLVADVQEIADHFNFVGDLGPTENGDERSLRFGDCIAEERNFPLDERADDLGALAHRLGDRDHRGIEAMAGSKSVVAVDIGHGGETGGKLSVALLLTLVEAQVLEHDDVTIFESSDLGSGIVTDSIGGKGDRTSDQLGESHGSWPQAAVRISSLRLTEVTDQNQPPATLKYRLNRRECALDTAIVGDVEVGIEGDIEVHSHQHSFTSDINRINGTLRHRNILKQGATLVDRVERQAVSASVRQRRRGYRSCG